jgi:outer membrane protein OmpA-like peptidoglycan-associated protein
VKDKTTLEPLPGSTVFILNEETNEVLVLKTNSTGCFRTKAIKGKPFIVKASKTSYIDDCLSYNFPVENKDTSLTLSRDLLLDKLEVNKTFKLDNIYYDFDKSFIRPDAEPPLNKLVSLMKEQPISVELGSHTDCRGSFPYNDRLSQRRAEAAVMYIIMQGISSSRIVAKGYGKHRLTNRCDCSKGVPCTEEEHQLNRRTEFKVTAINEDKNNGGFNPDRFKDGERLDARLLPFDFFNNCKDNEKKSSAVNVPSPNATENPLYTEVKAKAQKDLSQSVKMSEVNYASKSSSLPRANAPSQTFQTVGVTYTVQIAAGNAIRQDYLRNADHVMSCKGTDGITRYYVGKFTTKDEAVQYREQLRSKGYADAFLAKFDDNHRP